MDVMATLLLFVSTLMSADTVRIGEATAHFEAQSGCVTKRLIVSKARPGDAALPEPWEQRDGSFVRARVTRAGTVEVERCVCAVAGAAAVRVVVTRSK